MTATTRMVIRYEESLRLMKHVLKFGVLGLTILVIMPELLKVFPPMNLGTGLVVIGATFSLVCVGVYFSVRFALIKGWKAKFGMEEIEICLPPTFEELKEMYRLEEEERRTGWMKEGWDQQKNDH